MTGTTPSRKAWLRHLCQEAAFSSPPLPRHGRVRAAPAFSTAVRCPTRPSPSLPPPHSFCRCREGASSPGKADSGTPSPPRVSPPPPPRRGGCLRGGRLGGQAAPPPPSPSSAGPAAPLTLQLPLLLALPLHQLLQRPVDPGLLIARTLHGRPEARARGTPSPRGGGSGARVTPDPGARRELAALPAAAPRPPPQP